MQSDRSGATLESQDSLRERARKEEGKGRGQEGSLGCARSSRWEAMLSAETGQREEEARLGSAGLPAGPVTRRGLQTPSWRRREGS